MADCSFLTGHAPVLLCIARDPGVRLRDIAARTGVTERTAYGIVTDLTGAGHVVKHKDARRDRYQIQAHLPLPRTDSRERAIGEILVLLAGPGSGRRRGAGLADCQPADQAPAVDGERNLSRGSTPLVETIATSVLGSLTSIDSSWTPVAACSAWLSMAGLTWTRKAASKWARTCAPDMGR